MDERVSARPNSCRYTPELWEEVEAETDKPCRLPTALSAAPAPSSASLTCLPTCLMIMSLSCLYEYVTISQAKMGMAGPRIAASAP